MIICYARTSVDKKTESIENQFAIMDDYIQAQPELHGAEIIRLADEGYSGIDTERAGFQEMLALVRQRAEDVIVVKDLSRLGRNYLDVCKLTESIFPFMGVRLIAVSDHYDSLHKQMNTVDFSTAFKSVLNEYYVIEASEKVHKSAVQRIRDGQFLGLLPYGYRKIDKYTVEIMEDQAAVIREIFTRHLDGESTKHIAQALNAKGIPTQQGTKWTSNKVLCILKQESYTGKRTALKKRKNIKTKKRLPTDESEWYVNETGFPVIIEREVFERAKALLPVRQARDITPKHVMANKLYCGGCGRTLYRHEHEFGCKLPMITGEPPCFEGAVQREYLYHAVLKKVQKALKTELEHAGSRSSFSDIENQEKELKRLKEQKAEIFEKLFSDSISQDEFELQNRLVSQRIALLQEAIQESRRSLAMHSKQGMSEQPIKTLKRLYEAKELTMEHMQFVSRITVYDTAHLEIQMQEDSPLAVLCKNVNMYEEA